MATKIGTTPSWNGTMIPRRKAKYMAVLSFDGRRASVYAQSEPITIRHVTVPTVMIVLFSSERPMLTLAAPRQAVWKLPNTGSSGGVSGFVKTSGVDFRD